MSTHEQQPARRFSLAELQDLRDQYRDEVDERARRACMMLTADGGVYVRVERDGTAHHYSRGRLLHTARAPRADHEEHL